MARRLITGFGQGPSTIIASPGKYGYFSPPGLLAQGGGGASPQLPQFGSWYIGGQSNYGSTAFKNWSAQCKVIWLNTWDGFGNFGGSGTTPKSITDAIVALNPSVKIVEYAEPSYQAVSPNGGNSPVWTAAGAANWWLRASYPSGTIKQTETPLNDMDVMAGGSTYTSGTPTVARDWLSFLPAWTWDYVRLGGSLGLAANSNLANPNMAGMGFDDFFVLTGNSQAVPSSADWQRTGTAQAAGNSTGSQLQRQAYATMVSNARSTMGAGGLVGANVSQITSITGTPTEFAGILDVAFAEGSLGYPWSDEHNFGFSKFLADMTAMSGTCNSSGYYVLISGNLTTSGADPSAFSGDTPTAHYPNWTGARYGFASTFVLVPTSNPCWFPCPGDNANGGYSAANAGTLWFDEMAISPTLMVPILQSLATASNCAYLGSRDAVGTLDAASGCYYATFTNVSTGTRWIVIVNPKGNSTTASVNVLGLTGKNFKAFTGTQDATTNNGATTSTVTFTSARDGRVGQLV